VWLSTITFPPTLSSLSWGKGEWTVRAGRNPQQNRFARLGFAEYPHPGYAEFWPDLPDREWDKALNQAAMLVDELTEDGEEVLTLSSEQLVAFHGFASDVGGRYRFLFYLLRNRLLDRDGFDRIAPPDLIPRLVRNPPRVAVTTTGWMPTLLTVFPELRSIGKHYRVVGQFRRILVLARNDVRYETGGALSQVRTSKTTATSSPDVP
jgi:hypothetical protein